MLWLVPAASAALFDALKDVVSKRSLRSISPYVVAVAFRLFGLPLLACLLLLAGVPSVQPQFWLALVVSGSLNVVSLVLYMKAIQHSDLSLTVPMVAFTPLFLLITSPLINGEMPSHAGIAGVALIVLGSYMLNIGLAKNGFWQPFRAIVTTRGTRLMLAVALLWSISSNFDKIGVQASSPVLWTFSVALFGTLWLLPLALWRSPADVHHLRSSWKHLLPVGIISAMMILAFSTAVSMTFVAYAISVKRTSVVMGVVFGRLLFAERDIRSRLLGASMMLAGVVVISLWG
jgi:drug/metabolite transporter (DMT)-like permease